MAKHPRSPARKRRAAISDEWVSDIPFEKLPEGATHLPIECVVYVPSTQLDRGIGDEAFAARRRETAEFLVTTFGGCREELASGWYQAHDGDLIQETVGVLTGFGEEDDYTPAKRERLLAWLLAKKAEWKQEAIGFEFEGDLWYI